MPVRLYFLINSCRPSMTSKFLYEIKRALRLDVSL